ncbi:MAG: hypothetical protein ACREMG_01895 [Gemmatimonadales bacterium]
MRQFSRGSELGALAGRLGVAALVIAVAACSDNNGGGGPSEPDPPTGLAVQQLSLTSAHISWDAVAGADRYVLERAASPNLTSYTDIGGAALTTTSFDDLGLTEGLEYSYRVSTVEGTATSAGSAGVSFTSGLKAATINTNVTADRTLFSDTVYTLAGFIQVGNGATLTIQPGTTIVGSEAVPGSALFVLRGAKIEANGTATDPIVFTSARAAGGRAPGDWGGLILLGNGNLNRTATNCTTEGPAASAQNYCKASAGDFDDNDDSGTIRYVRIEFAGFDIGGTGGKELNSLTMYRVGRGTTLEYIQSMSGLDDSFEWFGGNVDARYLVSYEAGDDHFDWTEGYRGRNQFLIAFQTQRLTPSTLNPTGQFSSDPRGFEGDGCDAAANVDCTFDSEPFSVPVFANFTVVGPGNLAGLSSTLRNVSGATIRRGSGGVLINGIIGRWKGYCLNVQDPETDVRRQVDSLNVVDIVFAECLGGNYDLGNAPTELAGQPTIWDASNHRTQAGNGLSDLITSLNPVSLNWAPVGGSVATLGGSGDAANGGVAITVTARFNNFFGAGLPQTAYVGAAGPGDSWWTGWTAYNIN